MSDDWFAAKTIGIGAGLPIAWQGWAVLGAYLGAVVGLKELVEARHPAVFGVMVAVLTIALIVVVAQHTRGGWHWRWGGKDDR